MQNAGIAAHVQSGTRDSFVKCSRNGSRRLGFLLSASAVTPCAMRPATSEGRELEVRMRCTLPWPFRWSARRGRSHLPDRTMPRRSAPRTEPCRVEDAVISFSGKAHGPLPRNVAVVCGRKFRGHSPWLGGWVGDVRKTERFRQHDSSNDDALYCAGGHIPGVDVDGRDQLTDRDARGGRKVTGSQGVRHTESTGRRWARGEIPGLARRFVSLECKRAGRWPVLRETNQRTTPRREA